MNDWKAVALNIADRVPMVESPEDYYKDGLLYCGICHSQKQTKVDILGSVETVPCICKCRQEEIKRAEEKLREMNRQAEIGRKRNECFSASAMRDWTFAHDDGGSEKIIEVAKRFCDNFETFRKDGKGLLMYGTVGTGKSYASACIANELIDRGYRCYMTNFSTLANKLTSLSFEKKQDFLDGLSRYDLMVIDDLATERDTEFMNEVVQTIVDTRYRTRKPMIVTTNLTAEELKNPSDMVKKRIYSRLYEMCCPVKAEGKDRRRKALKKNVSDYSSLLGLGGAE